MTLLQELDKVYFFMKRDMRSFSTYKTNILLSVLSALFGALSYAFLGSNAQMQSVLNSYHIDFTTYLFRLRRSLKREHNWNRACGDPGNRHIHRLQHDWRRNFNPDQTRRPHNNRDNNRHEPFWERAFPASSYASGAAGDFVFCSAILLFHNHQGSVDWSDPDGYSARFVGSGIDVRGYSAPWLLRLLVVPPDSQEERHAFMVLEKHSPKGQSRNSMSDGDHVIIADELLFPQ